METSRKENQSFLSKIGISYLIGTIIIIALQLIISRLYYGNVDEKYYAYGFLLTMAPVYLVGFPVVACMVKRVPAEPALERQKLSFKEMLIYFLIAYAAMFVFNIAGNVLASIIGIFKSSGVQNGILEIATSNSLWMNFLVMVICAPIVEEFLFRKFLIDRMKRFGERFAILVSALMFGLFHGNIYQFGYAFAIGVVFAYVYCRTQDVKYSIILHMIINFMGSILGIIVLRVSGLLEIMSGDMTDQAAMVQAMMQNIPGLMLYLLYMLLIFGMVIAGIILFFLRLKKTTLRPATVVIEKGEMFKTTCLNVGMGLYFLFWIGYIIYATFLV